MKKNKHYHEHKAVRGMIIMLAKHDIEHRESIQQLQTDVAKLSERVGKYGGPDIPKPEPEHNSGVKVKPYERKE
jgi:hypothetical protein